MYAEYRQLRRATVCMQDYVLCDIDELILRAYCADDTRLCGRCARARVCCVQTGAVHGAGKSGQLRRRVGSLFVVQ